MRQFQLTVPRSTYSTLIARAQETGRASTASLGIAIIDDCIELLTQPYAKTTGVLTLHVHFVHQLPEVPLQDNSNNTVWDAVDLYRVDLFTTSIKQSIGVLYFNNPSRTRPLDTINLVGPEMQLKTLTPQVLSVKAPTLHRPIYFALKSQLGNNVWQRLVSLKFCLVGCNSIGSLIAETLTRSGVKKLTLLDPAPIEVTELSSIAGAKTIDIGLNRVEVSKAYLQSIGDHSAEVKAFSFSPQVIAGIDAIRQSDLVISSSESEPVRLFTSMLCALFLKPHLDIGYKWSEDAEGESFHEIHLFLPGDQRCLYCSGTLNTSGGLETLLPPYARKRPNSRDTPACALVSNNSILSGTAVQLIEGLIANRIQTSTALRLEYKQGIPKFTPINLVREINCPVCALSGLGDAGLKRLPHQLQILLNRDIQH